MYVCVRVSVCISSPKASTCVDACTFIDFKLESHDSHMTEQNTYSLTEPQEMFALCTSWKQ